MQKAFLRVTLTSIIRDRTTKWKPASTETRVPEGFCMAQTVWVCMGHVPPSGMCLNIRSPASSIVEPSWGGARLAEVSAGLHLEESISHSQGTVEKLLAQLLPYNQKASLQGLSNTDWVTPATMSSWWCQTETSRNHEPRYILLLLNCFFGCPSI